MYLSICLSVVATFSSIHLSVQKQKTEQKGRKSEPQTIPCVDERVLSNRMRAPAARLGTSF